MSANVRYVTSFNFHSNLADASQTICDINKTLKLFERSMVHVHRTPPNFAEYDRACVLIDIAWRNVIHHKVIPILILFRSYYFRLKTCSTFVNEPESFLVLISIAEIPWTIFHEIMPSYESRRIRRYCIGL